MDEFPIWLVVEWGYFHDLMVINPLVMEDFYGWSYFFGHI